MQKFQTLLFDADNTLFDFTASERIALESVFLQHGYPLNEEIKEAYERINVDLWKKY